MTPRLSIIPLHGEGKEVTLPPTDKKKLFDEANAKGWIEPLDLVKIPNQKGRYGDAMHVRIPDDTGASIDALIQAGRRFALFPKTRSEYLRNAIVWYTRRVLQEDPFKEHPDLKIVKLQLLHWEMQRAARADADLAAQFDVNLEYLRKYVSLKIVDLELDVAAESLEKFFDLVEQTKEVDPAKGVQMAKKIREDDGLMRAVGQVQMNGYEVRVPSVEAEGNEE